MTPEQFYNNGKAIGISPDEFLGGGGFVLDEPIKKPLRERAASALDTVFGGGKVGEAIGTAAARGTFGQTAQRILVGRDLSPEEEAQVGEGPSGREVAGSALQSASLFAPVGRIARGAQAAGRSIGLGTGAARVAGGAVAGGAAGAGFDIGEQLQGRDGAPINTIIGAGTPLAMPIARAATRVTSRLAGRMGGEFAGALSGTSQETFEQAFNAMRKGDEKQVQTFTRALREETTPEQLVNNLRESIETVDRRRQLLFRETLKEFGDEVVDTSAVRQNVANTLEEFGIAVKDGVLDFSKSKLRTVPAAQRKVQDMFEEVSLLGSEAPLRDVDTSRQALKALELAGEDASANAANAMIKSAEKSVRSAGQQIPEYQSLLENFADTSQFLDELKRGVASGDRKTVDQTYRRVITSLKTNNEQRMALIRELDELTDGAILSEVAGQQLSERMPRGIIRAMVATAAVGGATFGFGLSPAIIPSLLFASPRVSGEFTRALGLTARKADALSDAINSARKTLAETYNVAPENLIKIVAPTIRQESDER